MDQKIISFIQAQRVATICCVNEANEPYCFSCFYALDEERQLLYFKSSPETTHGQLLIHLPTIAGTIQPDKLNALAIQGIQFTGSVTDKKNELAFHASSAYHRKYPFALAMPGEVWTIQLEWVKMTDSTLGFGKKLVWEREVVIS